MNKTKYRSVFVSDCHLGSTGCQADLLCDFLKENTCGNLHLVGDIVDFWKLKHAVYWPQSHSNVIRRVLTAAKRGTKVFYTIGNHDEILRLWHPELLHIGNIEFSDHFDHELVGGGKMLITHGDLYDILIRNHRWIGLIGDRAYMFLLWINTHLNTVRRHLGFSYWSLSTFLKKNTKNAMAYITKFEDVLIKHAKDGGYRAVLCGHIHTPAIRRDSDGFCYLNDGDFCESLSAIVENHSGEFELLVWSTVENRMIATLSWSPTQ